LIFFVCAARDDPKRIVRQRPLQRVGFVPMAARIQTSRSSSVIRMAGGSVMPASNQGLRHQIKMPLTTSCS
jgi:hypothetical protein